MVIKFLRNLAVNQAVWKRCGDGCCSWTEWESVDFVAGEEVEPDNPWTGEVNLDGLEENKDFEIIES